METNKLKRFATEARNILMQGVVHRFTALGFRADGTPVEEPQLLGGGATFMGDTVTEDFYHKWQSLAAAIRRHGLKDVAEEAAYTWFNRLMAIRIMTKNGLIPPVLQYESPGVYVPLIVSEARQGRLPQMNEEEWSRLMPLLDDDSRTAEQFSLLIVAFCHATPILHCCFGHIADYTELLLPANILAEGGFVDLINHTDFIAEEDYRSSELIGWLYQFYIAEKKDEVFAAKGKFTASEIPAATQIFTPNWIVKYMVQNTVGRIYLDNNPYETEVAQDWKYLVNPSEPTPDDRILRYGDLTDLRLADLACGSGHILGEMFDMLYTLYINEGYSRREAIEHIFRRNLTGIDIDTRAKQLAQFALLLKACQRDASFADCHCMPRVLDMPLPYPDKEHLTRALADYIMTDNGEAITELADAVCLMDEADNLGSIMKFGLSERTRNILAVRTEEYEQQTMTAESVSGLLPYMRIILALTEQYHALVMNPPYMGGGNMNVVLSNYVKKNYEAGKADLFSVFMQAAEERLAENGKYGMINMQSWMFLSSFEKLRTHLLETLQIDSMLHLGPRTFDELSGEVVQNTAFVVTKHTPYTTGSYFRLVDGKNCGDKERMFLAGENGYPHVSQQNFEKIPGCPIGYWVSEKIANIFFYNTSIASFLDTRIGLITGDNEHYIRNWYEVSAENIEYNGSLNKKWYPQSKGGEYRKWYGNNYSIIDWSNDGHELQTRLHDSGTRILAHNFNLDKKFLPAITWTKISSGNISFRRQPAGFLFNDASVNAFAQNESDLLYILGFLNTNLTKGFLRILNPTLNILPGSVSSLPLKETEIEIINKVVSQNISISKSDWDTHETSWDFEENELVRLSKEQGEGPHRLSDLMEAYKEHWTEQFLQLHANEEELNRQFIEIYGLEDELTPDVPLSEVTILQQGEVKVTNEYLLTTEDGSIITDETGAGLTVSGKYYLDWQDDVIAKQLISYAVGCMLGRYRLDKPGLHIAHPEPTAEEIAAYTFNGKQWSIDEDGILPLMPSDTDFADNATVMFKRWLVVAFGEDTLVDNLNCVEAALGKSLDDYFVKDFWKDHKKMYQNRPIYWLFSSKKGAFQCLAYMHRMNAYTAERIRTKYLLPHIEWLVQKQSEMEANAANLNARERKQLDSITRQIAECREYHDRLHTVADEQIAFDLDDGVVVNYGKFGDVLAKLK
ncbi:BREX-1 system adenine-specific DNA-methyltransferase PglX [Bacteroides uniformis]|uniref:BREX-1 system adenine-specific DNA-methyltransferase PglX n=1 Tax=Bacteroides uniformis TaxID=820 RepID=UPI001C37DDEF|nr:BREX-1 system adenine-specific DNA-methyltransferase PglX [Bacteroides uniformis]MBV3485573.1 BREX-1 system adenine-specific DNA-methyltransferase PglX [Bacteroides uniformis]MBV3505752.1 BREX-1 system adenine-specific DNA-methyltransferase PglX [Bacteroides uniformis]MBV3538010.1 BREX-1 system adenine-specific DNA-methyltransferase PglX [Bacteroides uniformis]MBV3550960.1 BREX-1 system adenine-specific DNA-methyltransferase PglX [Bacteroides uniformis]MBV3554092.1 BREX-1 system adenine-spe